MWALLSFSISEWILNLELLNPKEGNVPFKPFKTTMDKRWLFSLAGSQVPWLPLFTGVTCCKTLPASIFSSDSSLVLKCVLVLTERWLLWAHAMPALAMMIKSWLRVDLATVYWESWQEIELEIWNKRPSTIFVTFIKRSQYYMVFNTRQYNLCFKLSLL